MALRNTNLTKIGNTQFGVGGQTQMCLVKPATALPDPGPRNQADPTWPSRYQQYSESIQVTVKYSQDSE
jgi:hypothetical protein